MATVTTSTEQRKSIIRQGHEELNKKGIAAIDEFDKWFAPNIVVHQGSGAELKGLAAWKEFMKASFTTFPDLHLTIDDLIAEGDKVAYRYSWKGTFKNEMKMPTGNIPPTGKEVKYTAFVFERFEGNKIAERWATGDSLTLYRQMGIPLAGK